MTDDRTLPAALGTGRGRVSTLDQLADLPEQKLAIEAEE
jgi:hypothetical protein